MTTMARVRVFDASHQLIAEHPFPSLKSATEAFYRIVADTPPESHVQYEAALYDDKWCCTTSVYGGFDFSIVA